MSVIYKSKKDVGIMREAGRIARRVLEKTLSSIKPGITTLELDQIAEEEIRNSGGEPSFKTVSGYNHATCININEGIVHGLPGLQRLVLGDIVSVDLGVLFRGFHSDLAYTTEVLSHNEDQFLDRGKYALSEAVKQCVTGKRMGDISNAIQKNIEKYGYSVSRQLVGHGIGKDLHEDPFVPGYGRSGKGLLLKEGMVLAIEVIYQKGKPEIEIDSDGWTVKTVDSSLSGLFEHTVAVGKSSGEILTA